MSIPSESNPQPGEDGSSVRVRCLYCGTSNFPSVAACWQCGRPLLPLPSGGATKPSESSVVPAFAAATKVKQPQAIAFEENNLAVKAAATLGLMFPYIAIPVGIVFLMLDDPRKARLGWITIGWSIGGTVATTLLGLLTIGPLLAMLKAFISQTGHSSGLPGLPPSDSGPSDLVLLFSTIRLYTGHMSPRFFE